MAVAIPIYIWILPNLNFTLAISNFFNNYYCAAGDYKMISYLETNEQGLEKSVGTQCPHCGISLPVNKGYVTWCHGCGWNIEPDSENQAAGKGLVRLYEQIGRRLGKRLLDDLILSPAAFERSGILDVLAVGCSLFIHSISLVFPLSGAWLLYWTHFSLPTLILAFLMFAVSWISRPRFPKLQVPVVERERFPVLYRIADSIAEQSGVRQFHGIIITEEYNAAWVRYGLLGKHVLILGLPLLRNIGWK